MIGYPFDIIIRIYCKAKINHTLLNKYIVKRETLKTNGSLIKLQFVLLISSRNF